MTTQKFTFIRVFEIYLTYSEAYSQYNQLEEEDKKVIKPYLDHLKERWEEELRAVREQFTRPLLNAERIQHKV